MSVMRILPALCLAGVLQAQAAEVDTVAGRVYLDANGNGQFDAGEKGLPGIRVTDSVNFVSTAGDGSYTIRVAEDPEIPWRPGRVVSLSWPGGQWPSGAWWRRLSDIKPGEKVDFGLRDNEQKLPFLFVHIGDDHGSGGGYAAFGALVQEQLMGLARFCINTGDLGYAGPDNADQMFADIARRAKAFPVPMFFTPGNHDMNGRIPDWGQGPLAGTGAFTQYLGPIRWSFTYAGAHFAGVDWADVKHGSHESTPEIAADWLDRDLGALPPGTRSFVFMHFPSACARFVEVVAKYKVTHIFGGHNHTHSEYTLDGIPATTTINLRGKGCLLGIVQSNAFDVVAYCGGCKGTPGYHSKACALGKFQSSLRPPIEQRVSLLPELERRHGQHAGASAQPLSSSTHILDAGPGPVQVAAEIEPGTARKCGLRIGAGETVEIAWADRILTVAGVPIPCVLTPPAKTVSCQLLIEHNTLTFYANQMIRLVKSVNVDQAAKVTLFAESGRALFNKVDVWALTAPAKPAATEKSK